MPNTLQTLLGRNQIPNVPNPEPPGWNNLRAAMMQRFFSQMSNPYGLSGQGNAPRIGQMQPYSPYGNHGGGFGGPGGPGGFMQQLLQMLGGRGNPMGGGSTGTGVANSNPAGGQQQDQASRMPIGRTAPHMTPPLPGPFGGMMPGLQIPRGGRQVPPRGNPMGPTGTDSIGGAPNGPISRPPQQLQTYDGGPSYAGSKMGFSPIHPPRMPRQQPGYAKSPAMGALMRTLGPVGSAARSGQLAANRTTRRPQVYDGESYDGESELGTSSPSYHYDAIGPVGVGGGGGVQMSGPGNSWVGGQFIPIGSRSAGQIPNQQQIPNTPQNIPFRQPLGGPGVRPQSNVPYAGATLSQRPLTNTGTGFNGMPGLSVPTGSRPTHTISAYPGGSPFGGGGDRAGLDQNPVNQDPGYDGKKEVSGHLKNHGDMLKKLLPMLLMGGGSSAGMGGGMPSPPISAGRGF